MKRPALDTARWNFQQSAHWPSAAWERPGKGAGLKSSTRRKQDATYAKAAPKYPKRSIEGRSWLGPGLLQSPRGLFDRRLRGIFFRFPGPFSVPLTASFRRGRSPRLNRREPSSSARDETRLGMLQVALRFYQEGFAAVSWLNCTRTRSERQAGAVCGRGRSMWSSHIGMVQFPRRDKCNFPHKLDIRHVLPPSHCVTIV